MNPKYSDEIHQSRIAHASVKSNLASSAILLSATHSHRNPLCHQLGEPDPATNGERVAELNRMVDAAEEKTLSEGEGFMAHSSLGFLKSLRARMAAGDVRQEADEWYRFRHHDLLMSLLRLGIVPCGWKERSERAGITTLEYPPENRIHNVVSE